MRSIWLHACGRFGEGHLLKNFVGQVYGELEYWFGCVKMVTIVGLILLMIIITNGSCESLLSYGITGRSERLTVCPAAKAALPNGNQIGDRCTYNFIFSVTMSFLGSFFPMNNYKLMLTNYWQIGKEKGVSSPEISPGLLMIRL